MMSLWDALRMNMMISYQELVRTFLNTLLLFYRLLWDTCRDSYNACLAKAYAFFSLAVNAHTKELN